MTNETIGGEEMTQEQKAGQATPASTLEQHIMDSNIAKSEAEWWARAEIATLRATNARLIAQAPAMLEALQDVEKYLIQIDDENGNEHMYECPGEDSCILCQVREVIRLAKGEPEP